VANTTAIWLNQNTTFQPRRARTGGPRACQPVGRAKTNPLGMGVRWTPQFARRQNGQHPFRVTTQQQPAPPQPQHAPTRPRPREALAPAPIPLRPTNDHKCDRQGSLSLSWSNKSSDPKPTTARTQCHFDSNRRRQGRAGVGRGPPTVLPRGGPGPWTTRSHNDVEAAPHESHTRRTGARKDPTGSRGVASARPEPVRSRHPPLPTRAEAKERGSC